MPSVVELEIAISHFFDTKKLTLKIENRSHDIRDTIPETIDSGPMCITDFFQNKS